jgi:hypothetical protein
MLRTAALQSHGICGLSILSQKIPMRWAAAEPVSDGRYRTIFNFRTQLRQRINDIYRSTVKFSKIKRNL